MKKQYRGRVLYAPIAIIWSRLNARCVNQGEYFKYNSNNSRILRKGTSTRKPRLNPSVVQQQTLVQLAVQQQSSSQSPSTR
jgi:hypothetical protein